MLSWDTGKQNGNYRDYREYGGIRPPIREQSPQVIMVVAVRSLFITISWAGASSKANLLRGLKRWDEGRWDKGDKPQYSRTYSRDPLTHLALSHLLSPMIFCITKQGMAQFSRRTCLLKDCGMVP